MDNINVPAVINYHRLMGSDMEVEEDMMHHLGGFPFLQHGGKGEIQTVTTAVDHCLMVQSVNYK